MKDFYWLIVDEWKGQEVYRSDNLFNWECNGLILDQSGNLEDNGKTGLHADVVCSGEEAYIFYFTHPERKIENEPSSVPPYK